MKRMVRKLIRKAGYTLVRTSDAARTGVEVRGDSWTVRFQEVRHSGARYFVPGYASHRPAAQAILGGNFYEPDTHDLIRHIGAQEKGEVVHAGTFFGDMLPSFAKAIHPARLYAFEPVLENYVLARLCVSRNDLDNVVLINAALSDTIANLRIDTEGEGGTHRGGSSMIAERGEIVPSLPIDALSFDNLVCLQLDVEGHEVSALKGALQTIKAHHPIILVEDNNRACGPLLSDLGYQSAGRIPGLEVWYSERRKHLLEGIAGLAVN